MEIRKRTWSGLSRKHKVSGSAAAAVRNIEDNFHHLILLRGHLTNIILRSKEQMLCNNNPTIIKAHTANQSLRQKIQGQRRTSRSDSPWSRWHSIPSQGHHPNQKEQISSNQTGQFHADRAPLHDTEKEEAPKLMTPRAPAG